MGCQHQPLALSQDNRTQVPPFPTPGPRDGAPGPARERPHPPALLALQQLAVGGDLHVQGQLDVHQLLVFAQLPRHVLLGGSQSGLQLGQLGLSILDGQLPMLLSIGNGGLQGSPLRGERTGKQLEQSLLASSPPPPAPTLPFPSFRDPPLPDLH